MVDIPLPEGDGSEAARMWSLRPALGDAVAAFGEAIRCNSILPVRESEAARIRIAHINGCGPCSDARIEGMALFGLDEAFYAEVDDPALRANYTLREQLAIAFAERFAVGRQAFDDAFRASLHAAFSPAEIVDLATCVAKFMAIGRINAVFGIAAASPIRIPHGR